MKLFRQFVSQTQHLLAYRTEWGTYAEEERLAGCVDFAAENADGDLVLFDEENKGPRFTKDMPWQWKCPVHSCGLLLTGTYSRVAHARYFHVRRHFAIKRILFTSLKLLLFYPSHNGIGAALCATMGSPLLRVSLFGLTVLNSI